MALRYFTLKFAATAESTSAIAACSAVTRTAAGVPSTRTPAWATPEAPPTTKAISSAAVRRDRRKPPRRAIACRSVVIVISILVAVTALQLDEDARTMTDLGKDVTVGVGVRLDVGCDVGRNQGLAILRDHAGDGRDRIDRGGLAGARTGRERFGE